MKKIHLFLLLLLIFPILSIAQKNELFLGLSGGINYPLGEFASTEYVIDEETGFDNIGQFAKLGSAFDFSANYRIGYYFGLSSRIMGGTNKVNTNAYSDALNSIDPDGEFEVTVSSKGWGNMGLFAGGYFVVPVYDFYIDLRAMVGYLNLFSPAMRYYIYDEDHELISQDPYVSEKYNAGGFAYDIGLGIKYKFSSNKFILLNGDYIASHVKKDKIQTLDPFSQDEITVDMDVDYQNITITVGLGYIF